MFCSKCGANIPDGSAFCSQCGNPVNNAPVKPNIQLTQGNTNSGTSNYSQTGYNQTQNYNQSQNYSGFSNANNLQNLLSKKINNCNQMAAFAFIAYILLNVIFRFIWNLTSGYNNFFESILNTLDYSLANYIYYVPLIIMLFINIKKEILIAGVALPLIHRLVIFHRVATNSYQNLFRILVQFIQFLSWGTLLALVIIYLINNLHLYRNQVKNYYFIPATIMLTSIILYLVFNNGIINLFNSFTRIFTYGEITWFLMDFFDLIAWILEAAGIFLFGKWVTE